MECDPTGASKTVSACSTLTTPPYYLACQRSPTATVYCNGPQRTMPSDQNVAGCTVSRPEGSWSDLAAAGALVVGAALLARRRRA